MNKRTFAFSASGAFDMKITVPCMLLLASRGVIKIPQVVQGWLYMDQWPSIKKSMAFYVGPLAGSSCSYSYRASVLTIQSSWTSVRSSETGSTTAPRSRASTDTFWRRSAPPTRGPCAWVFDQGRGQAVRVLHVHTVYHPCGAVQGPRVRSQTGWLWHRLPHGALHGRGLGRRRRPLLQRGLNSASFGRCLQFRFGWERAEAGERERGWGAAARSARLSAPTHPPTLPPSCPPSLSRLPLSSARGPAPGGHPSGHSGAVLRAAPCPLYCHDPISLIGTLLPIFDTHTHKLH
jgi:hypothetical protein